MKKILCAGLLALLGGCSIFSGGPDLRGKTLDEVLMPVADEHRDERACLALAGLIELGVTRELWGTGGDRTAVYGRLVVLREAIDRVAAMDPNYRNADAVEIGFDVLGVATGATRDRAAGYAAAGLSLGTAFDFARNTAVQSTKADALTQDIVAILERLEAGDLNETETWDICTARADAQLARVAPG